MIFIYKNIEDVWQIISLYMKKNSCFVHMKNCGSHFRFTLHKYDKYFKLFDKRVTSEKFRFFII